MRIGRIKVLTLFWLINFKTLLTHDLDKCPPPWQWKLRAKAFCNTSPEQYSCLNDVIQKIYKESCSGKPDYVKPGKRYVIRGERDNDNCSNSSYQPFKLWSNRSSECEFIKNECNEMGQVIVSNGSTTKDRTCRCDYTKGFDFVIKPINDCYCIPSEEDCVCYLKNCLLGEKLTKDYECDSTPNQTDICKPMKEIWKPSFGSSSTIRPIRLLDGNGKHMEPNIHPLFVLLWITIISLSSCILAMVLWKTLHPLSKKKDAVETRPTNGDPPTGDSSLLEDQMVVITEDTSIQGIDKGVNNKIKQSTPFNLILVNRALLIEEMDIEMMCCSWYKKKGLQFAISNSRSRKENARIICDVLQEQPNIKETFYEILDENNLDYLKIKLIAS